MAKTIMLNTVPQMHPQTMYLAYFSDFSSSWKPQAKKIESTQPRQIISAA